VYNFNRYLPSITRANWRVRFVQAGILATFALTSVWYRVPGTQPILLFTPLYTVRFAIFLAMLWTIGWWLIAGLPGFAELGRDRLRSLWALGLLTLALWAYASTTWAFQRVDYPEVGETAALQLSMVALFAVVVACCSPSARVVAAVLVIGLVGNTIVTVLQVASQSDLGLRWLGEFALGPDFPGVSVVQSGAVRWLRPYGLLPHPNILAGILVIGLLACAVWITSARRWLRWLGTLVFLGGLWALLLTFSRGAWGSFAAGIFTIGLHLWRSGRLREREIRIHSAITAGLALVVGVLFVANYGSFIRARAGITTESIELRSVSDRFVFIQFAERAIQENPIIGVGIGNFPWRTSYYLVEPAFANFDLIGDNVHHVFLSAWAELGLIGLLLMTGTLFIGVEATLRSLRARPDPARIAMLAGFVALTAIGLLDHYPWSLPHTQVAWWGLLAVAAALGD